METRNMATPQGTVLAVADGKATIRLNRSQDGGCGNCAHGKACGMARLILERDDLQLQLALIPGLQAGDQVSLAEPKAGLPLLALLGYVCPALALVLGAALGQLVFGGDGPAVLCALLAFLLALVLTRLVVARQPGLCVPLLMIYNTELPHEH
jgi:sigma-E factor negative regulatory protein RseC